MGIKRHADHSPKVFVKRTISAQIHALGLILAIVGLAYLLPLASTFGAPHFWAALAFGLTSILVFATSSTYHFLHDGFHISPRLINLLETIDHFSIYLFIAGTYTPFLLNAVHREWRMHLMIAIWVIAIVGIFYTGGKHRLPQWAQRRAVYTSVYVLMGLTMVLRVGEIFHSLSTHAAWLLAAGGVSYVVGAVVYATKRPKLMVGIFGFHELWHVLVMMGFGFHYFMILSFYQNR